MVHRHIPILFFTPLKLRKIRHPEQIELILGDQFELVRHLQAQCAERREHNIVPIRNDEYEVAGFDAGTIKDRVELLFGKELCDRGLHAFRLCVDPSEPLCAVRFHIFAHGIDLFAGEMCSSALDVDAADAAARFDRVFEHAESAVLYKIGEVAEFQAKPHIRLIGTEARHCLIIGNARQRKLDVKV